MSFCSPTGQKLLMWTRLTTCLCSPNARVTGRHHHTPLPYFLLGLESFTTQQ